MGAVRAAFVSTFNDVSRSRMIRSGWKLTVPSTLQWLIRRSGLLLAFALFGALLLLCLFAHFFVLFVVWFGGHGYFGEGVGSLDVG